MPMLSNITSSAVVNYHSGMLMGKVQGQQEIKWSLPCAQPASLCL